MMMMYTFFVPS